MKKRAWTQIGADQRKYCYEVDSGRIVAEITILEAKTKVFLYFYNGDCEDAQYAGPQHWLKAQTSVEQKWAEKDAENV